MSGPGPSTTFVLLDLRPPGMDLLSDTALCVAAGALHRAGAAVRQIRATLSPNDRPRWEQLTAFVGAHERPWLVVERLWPLARLGELRERCDGRLLWLRQEQRDAPPPPVDAALGLDLDALGGLTQGAAPPSVPGLGWRDDGRWRFNPGPEAATVRRRRREAWAPRFAIETLPGEPPADRRHQTLVGNDSGCPYRAPLHTNPLFAGLDLSAPGRQRQGCSFCLDQHGGHEPEPPAATVSFLIRQLALLDEAVPELERLVLADDRPLPLLAPFLAAAPPRPRVTELWLKLRADDLLAGEAQLRSLGVEAATRGWTLALYCVGLESYSDRLLALFHKGLTGAQTRAATRLLRALDGAPGLRLAPGGAHGFLLWTPWTSAEDILENARVAGRLALHEIRVDWARTRLRLDPRLALHALAARQGLLAGGTRGAALDRAGEQGYDEATSWGYADPRAALLDRLFSARPAEGAAQAEELEWLARNVLDLSDEAVRAALEAPAEEARLARALRRAAELGGWEPWHDEAARHADLPAVARRVDTSLESLRAGLRAAAIRESLPEAAAEDLAFLLTRQGLSCALAPEAGQAGRRDVLVTRDADTLAGLRSAHEALRGGRDADAAARRIGALLGYPDCCVEGFLARPDRRDDVASLAASLGRTRGEADGRLGIFALRQLIPFHPCRLDCPAAQSFATATLESLRARWGAELAEAVARAANIPQFITSQRARFFLLDAGWQEDRLHFARVAGPPSPTLRRLAAAGSLTPEAGLGEPGLLLVWSQRPEPSWDDRSAPAAPAASPAEPLLAAEERLLDSAARLDLALRRHERAPDKVVLVFEAAGETLRLELSPSAETARAYRRVGEVAASYRLGPEDAPGLPLERAPAALRALLDALLGVLEQASGP